MSTESPSSDIAAQAASIAERIGLALPASATPEYAEFIEGHDDAARLVYSMPAEDWEGMRAQPPFDEIGEEYYSPDNAFHLGRDEGAWNPRSIAGLTAAQIPLRDGRESLNVGYIAEASDRVRVYFFWYQL